MYKIDPPAVYMNERVEQDVLSSQRMKRMTQAMGIESPIVIGDEDIPELMENRDLKSARIRQGRVKNLEDPIIVFNAFKWNGHQAEETKETLERCPAGTSKALIMHLLGYHPIPLTPEIRSGQLICRSCYEFNTIDGCLHRCSYCAGGQVVNIMLNLEEYIERELDEVVKKAPWQKVFRYNTQTSDTLCFEPEYGATKLFAEYFAGLDDRYFLVHTKSANVDHMLDLDHKGHTIALWSLTSHTVSRKIEAGSGTTEERIEAAAKCEKAGYPVRFKFKPVIPVEGWRDECRDMIERIFKNTKPDVISLCVLMWINADEFRQTFDVSLFDAECIRAMDESADEMKGQGAGPFPHSTRAEIYRFLIDEIRKINSSIPLSLSTET